MLGDIVVGPIPNQKTENNISVNGPTVTIPGGYYNGRVTKTVTTATRGVTTVTMATTATDTLVITA
jgi:hypothetical protein